MGPFHFESGETQETSKIQDSATKTKTPIRKEEPIRAAPPERVYVPIILGDISAQRRAARPLKISAMGTFSHIIKKSAYMQNWRNGKSGAI